MGGICQKKRTSIVGQIGQSRENLTRGDCVGESGKSRSKSQNIAEPAKFRELSLDPNRLIGVQPVALDVASRPGTLVKTLFGLHFLLAPGGMSSVAHVSFAAAGQLLSPLKIGQLHIPPRTGEKALSTVFQPPDRKVGTLSNSA
jgi:hypothetical protein